MHSWRNGRRSRLRSGRRNGVEVQVLPGAPTIARFAKRLRHRSYTPTFPGSSPGASTTPRFVSLAAKAPARHAGDPRFESATKHQHLSRSSMAERPADNRKTAVRYRAGEPSPQAGDHRVDQDQTGAACRRISIADGPGAFKPETVGQRAFNPRARGSTPPGSPSRISHTQLAQSVEHRPLKSEVRGSSPRSCTNSHLTCDASVEADPLSTG
jgi:hypothetical protein